jgi:hypothetical protein
MFLVDHTANQLIVWKEGSHGNKLTFLDWIRGHRPAPDLPFQSDVVSFDDHPPSKLL